MEKAEEGPEIDPRHRLRQERPRLGQEKRPATIDEQHLGVVGGRFGFQRCRHFRPQAGRRVSRTARLRRGLHRFRRIHQHGQAGADHPAAAADSADRRWKTRKPRQTDTPYQAEHICEPSPEELLGDLLPRNVYVQIFSACWKPPPASTRRE
jgi:F-type H+-transporting ATPase subunit gamma